MTNNCEFYCLSFNNEERKRNMAERFKYFNIDCKIYTGVPHDDNRIINRCLHNYNKRNWSITYGHLDMIYDFYMYSDKKFAVICEDDIFIHKDFNNIFQKVFTDFNLLALDILLLGYNLPYKIIDERISNRYKLKAYMPKESLYKYHEYPEYLCGTNMYMITKSFAKCLLCNYYLSYAGIHDNYFIADKIIIKRGNRAIIYPMLAIEDNKQEDPYHKLCHKIHYNENYI